MYGSSRSAKPTLGIGLRLIQIYYGVVFIFGLLYATVKDPADFEYDLSLFWALLQMVVCTQAMWLIQKRARSARYVVIIGTSISCVLAAIDLYGRDAISDVARVIGIGAANMFSVALLLCGISCVLYMLFSHSAKTKLFVKRDTLPYAKTGHSWDEPWRQRIKTWVFWRDLLIYFVVFSFIGHWAELLFCWFIYLGVFMGDVDFNHAMLWSQWLYPYTAEGEALVLVVILLHPAKERLIKVFKGHKLPALIVSIVIVAIVCVGIDFSLGMLVNQDYSLWDYRDLPFNFMGQVCLQNSFVYTTAATLIVWVIYPVLDRLIRRLPKSYADGFFFSVAGIYLFCAALHFMYLTPSGFIMG